MNVKLDCYGGAEMLDKALIMAKGMNRRFPDGNSPYEMM